MKRLSRNRSHPASAESPRLIVCLSADVMYKLGAHTVLAVDVGAQDEQNFYNFGDQLSGEHRTFILGLISRA